MDHSKYQGVDHAHIYCEYLVNGDSCGKLHYCYQIVLYDIFIGIFNLLDPFPYTFRM